jgi:hypothetical protein
MESPFPARTQGGRRNAVELGDHYLIYLAIIVFTGFPSF